MVNYFALDEYFVLFKELIKRKSNLEFVSFSNLYIDQEENYKKLVRSESHKILKPIEWKVKDIGSGNIINKTINCIELKENNLLTKDARYGESSMSHISLIEALKDDSKTREYEKLLYQFFKSELTDQDAFSQFLNIAKKKYSFIAFLFFIKDDRKYCPIASGHFDEIFKRLKIEFSTSHKCSWDNYLQFNNIIKEVKEYLENKLTNAEIHLIDAHSFLWILGNQLQRELKGITSDHQTIVYDIKPVEYILKPLEPSKIYEHRLQVDGNNNETSSEEYLESHRKNTITGHKAEEIVFLKEKEYLINNNREDLAEKVKIVSANNSLGYDILSFEIDGQSKFIEVKGSTSSQKNFYLSSNELEKSKLLRNYYLFLVTNVDNDLPQIYFLKNPDFENNSYFRIEPLQFRVHFN